MKCEHKYTQTLIFEWVKEGCYLSLREAFSKFNLKQRTFLFSARDSQQRTIIHWAAFLGQPLLLEWWLSEYHEIIEIDLEDNQQYSPLELGIIRGFNDVYDQEIQFRTALVLINHGASIKRYYTQKKPTPLHWAFYYANLELILLIIDKCYQIIFSQDDQGYYPIDYLFFDRKYEGLKENNEMIFGKVVQKYIDVNQLNKSNLECALSKRPLEQKIHTINEKNFQNSKKDLDDDAKFNPEIDPINSYHPSQYNLKIFRPELFPANHRRVISKQISNIMALSSRSNQAPSESSRSEPEEEKLPPNLMYSARQRSSQRRIEFNLKHSFISVDSQTSRKQAPQYVIYQYPKMMSKSALYETRLLFWSASMGMAKFVYYFLLRKCSPFMITYNGFNSLHIAAQKGQYETLKIFLDGEYIYQEYQESIALNQTIRKNLQIHTFNKKHCLNMLTSQLPSNALHLSIESENYDCMRLLFEYHVSIKKFNYRTLRPFELTFNEKIVDFYTNNIKLDDPTNFQQQGYQYVLQTPGKFSYQKDIVYIQLQNIEDTFRKNGWKFEFLILKSPNLNQLSSWQSSPRKMPTCFFYIIKLQPNTIYQLADKYKLRCYHLKKKVIQKYLCEFSYRERMSFEFPKDIQIQTMIINIFNEEFDLEKFVLEGLILSHFPLEDYHKREDINRYWQKQQSQCIRNTVRFRTDQRALVPLHNIANYYGPVIGWYFAFVVQLVGWLTLPSVFGIILGLYILITQSYFSKIIPLYALFMAIWSTFFIEKWRNRTWELKFSWDMHDYKANEPERIMYTGQFTLDQINKKISIKDSFNTLKRRLFSDIPIIFLGLCFITITFFSFYQWNKVNRGNLIMIVFINSLNGTCITFLSSIYKLLCDKLIQWENHKYESEQQFSYILKVYLFEFLNSYITVFYYAVFEEDALRLGLSVGSIVITRGVLQNVTSNILPFIKQKIRLKIFLRKFNRFKKIYQDSKADNEVFQIDNQDHIDEKISPQLIIEFLQQLEECVLQEPQKLLFDEYTSIAIQYGYITMFSPSFPGAPIFFMINTYLNLRLSLYCYKSVMKRERLIPAESLGIWENIFAIMNYAATFMNCIVIGRANKSQLANLIGDGSFLRDAIILVSVEHVILFIKYILETLIPDIPYWVEKELKRYKFYTENR